MSSPGVTPVCRCGEELSVTYLAAPLPPPPQRVFRRHLVLHVALMVCTLGLWVPVWVLVWWTVDARNYAEMQRYRRDWAVYQEALADWRWRYSVAYGGPPPGAVAWSAGP